MGWNTELTAASAAGDEATYFPDTSDVHGYTSAVFTAPKRESIGSLSGEAVAMRAIHSAIRPRAAWVG